MFIPTDRGSIFRFYLARTSPPFAVPGWGIFVWDSLDRTILCDITAVSGGDYITSDGRAAAIESTKNGTISSVTVIRSVDVVQCDGWTSISQSLHEAGYTSSVRGFTAVVVCVGNFIVTNVIVGIILLNVDHATKKFEASMSSLEQSRSFAVSSGFSIPQASSRTDI